MADRDKEREDKNKLKEAEKTAKDLARNAKRKEKGKDGDDGDDKDKTRDEKRKQKDEEREKKQAEKDAKKGPGKPRPDGPADGPPTPDVPPTPILSPTDPEGTFLRLKVEDLKDLKIDPSNEWNIIKIGHGGKDKSDGLYSIIDYQGDQTLKINYPKGSFKPSADPIGGIGFYASPAPVFPEKSGTVTLSYDIYFDESFGPVKGGKLTGLFIGEPGASGGRKSNDKASARMMWRTADGSDKINAEVYVYISSDQDPSYKDIPNLVANPKFGDSLWRGDLKFKVGQWNRVVLSVKLNTFDGNRANKDGKLYVSINDISKSFDKLVYVEDKSVSIEGITTDTFFGGGDDSWATPNDTSVYMKNFVVTKM